MRPENPRQPEGGIKRKKWVPRTGGKHAQAKRPSVKNQIRSIERLLKRDGVPAKLREEKERELEKLRDAGKDNARIEREKKLSTKYHKVKFSSASSSREGSNSWRRGETRRTRAD